MKIKRISFLLITTIFIVFILAIFLDILPPSRPSLEQPKPIITSEYFPASEAIPKGLWRVQMEDILFEISADNYVIGHPDGVFDMSVCWMVDEALLKLSREFTCYKRGYGARLQFRARREPGGPYGSAYERHQKDDFKTMANYLDHSVYTLRPSTEYPGLDEFYLYKQKKAFQFVLDVSNPEIGRADKQRIHCSPSFRAIEKNSGWSANRACGYGQPLSVHVNLSVNFDSHIMPQIKLFEKQIHQFVNQSIVSHH